MNLSHPALSITNPVLDHLRIETTRAVVGPYEFIRSVSHTGFVSYQCFYDDPDTGEVSECMYWVNVATGNPSLFNHTYYDGKHDE